MRSVTLLGDMAVDVDMGGRDARACGVGGTIVVRAVATTLELWLTPPGDRSWVDRNTTYEGENHMASVKVSQQHSLPVEDAKKRVDQTLSGYVDKFGLKTSWEGNKLIVKGSGVEGHADVTGSSVNVELKLGLAASVFKGKVESGLKEELEKNFKA